MLITDRCWRRLSLATALAVGALASPGPAAADEFSAVRGRMLAEAYCSDCHAVGPDGSSPHPSAPPFRTLGKRWPIESLAEPLAEGLIVGHPDMPEVIMQPFQIDQFLAYLEALQQPQ